MTAAIPAVAEAVPDPALVEHLRHRAARDARAGGGDVTREDLADLVRDMVAEERRILTSAGRDALVEAVVNEALGLGPLEALLRDPEVTEVMVCGPGRVFVERAGRIAPAAARFHDDAHLLHVIDRILAPLGRRVDEASPMVDARLPDGSRVNAVIPPLALDGPALTIRRFAGHALTGDDLVELGTIDRPMLELLSLAVRARRNLLVTGGTGSGKTTTLAALAAFVPRAERLVTIEDAAELRIPLPHVVRLESRPPSLEGAGAVTIRALVRNALRMRPDRIVVGEVRGGEALDMLTTVMLDAYAQSVSTPGSHRDPDGSQTATARQLADCRALAEREAWEVVEVYEDADLSGFRPDVNRPDYRRMLDDLERGAIEAVLVWKLDRLSRQPGQFEAVVSACERLGARVFSVHEAADMTSPAGLAMMRVGMAFAAMESQTTSLRTRRAKAEAADAGRPNGGGLRPFGLDRTKTTIVEHEAALIREAARRVIGGEGLGGDRRRLGGARGAVESGEPMDRDGPAPDACLAPSRGRARPPRPRDPLGCPPGDPRPGDGRARAAAARAPAGRLPAKPARAVGPGALRPLRGADDRQAPPDGRRAVPMLPVAWGAELRAHGDRRRAAGDDRRGRPG